MSKINAGIAATFDSGNIAASKPTNNFTDVELSQPVLAEQNPDDGRLTRLDMDNLKSNKKDVETKLLDKPAPLVVFDDIDSEFSKPVAIKPSNKVVSGLLESYSFRKSLLSNEKFNLNLDDFKKMLQDISSATATNNLSKDEVEAVMNSVKQYIQNFKAAILPQIDKAISEAKTAEEKSKLKALKASLEKLKPENIKSADDILEALKDPRIQAAFEHVLKNGKNKDGSIVLEDADADSLKRLLLRLSAPSDYDWISRKLYEVDPSNFRSIFGVKDLDDFANKSKYDLIGLDPKLLKDADTQWKETQKEVAIAEKRAEEKQATAATRKQEEAARNEAGRLAKLALKAKDAEQHRLLSHLGNFVMTNMTFWGNTDKPKFVDLKSQGISYIQHLVKEGTLKRTDPEVERFLFANSQLADLKAIFPIDQIKRYGRIQV